MVRATLQAALDHAQEERHTAHAIDVRKSTLFSIADEDASGAIDKDEFDNLYDIIHKQTEKDVKRMFEANQATKVAQRRLHALACIMLLLLSFLGLSVAANSVMMHAIIEATKETKAGSDGVLRATDSDTPIQTSSITDVDGVLVTGDAHRHVLVDQSTYRTDLSSGAAQAALAETRERRAHEKAARDRTILEAQGKRVRKSESG